MSENTFEIGSTVQLKSGGPVMTVCSGSSVPGNPESAVGDTWVTWFPHGESKNPSYNRFETKMLRVSVAPQDAAPPLREVHVERMFGDAGPSFAALLRTRAEDLTHGRLSVSGAAMVLTAAAEEVEQLRARLAMNARVGRVLMFRHKHFWAMAREIRAYCEETRLPVVAVDNVNERTIQFSVDASEDDQRYREWHMGLSDVSLTAKDAHEFAGWGLDDIRRISHLMSDSSGRVHVAKALSTGQPPRRAT